MTYLPTKEEAKILLEEKVSDEYQRLHALMVGTALEYYAQKNDADTHLWFLTGYLHDLDFHLHPTLHPGESLKWFKDLQYPKELMHAVEAHADGYNGFTTKPETLLAKTLIACDEICGIFYAYKKLNPIKFSEMKVSSIKKRVLEKSFAPKIDRETVFKGCEYLGLALDQHIENIKSALSRLD